jgi:Beta/Gamma crystallin
MGFERIGFRAFRATVAAVAALVVVTPQGSIAQQPGHPQQHAAPPPARPVYRPPPVNVQRAPSFSQQAPNPQRPPASFVRPVAPPVVNPNAGINPNVNPNPNLNRAQPFHNNPVVGAPTPFGGQPRMAPEPGAPGQGPHIGAGPVPPHNVVVGPGNGLRVGPGRPIGPPGIHLAPGPGGFPHRPPAFPVVTVGNRFFPIVRGPRYVWWGGYRRAFIPLAALGIVAIGGSYWYPDGYVSVAQPYCTGLTPDGCQLNWRMVDFDGGGGAPQCVQYCPQVGPLPVPGPGQAPAQVASLPPPLPPAPANGTCQMTIFAEPNFAGAAAPTSEAQAALGEAGWLNEISSIQVQSGAWEFYADENFGGVSMRLDPGDYPNLAPEWTKHIGSFQCVQPT